MLEKQEQEIQHSIQNSVSSFKGDVEQVQVQVNDLTTTNK